MISPILRKILIIDLNEKEEMNSNKENIIEPKYLKCSAKLPDVPPHYLNLKYDGKKRFISYWYQINEIVCLEQQSILEIGIVRKIGLKVTTLDIDKRLEPDTVGSITNMPFSSELFEVIAVFEVLEHLPYEQFVKALAELNRVGKKFVILSLPDKTRFIKLDLIMPKIGEIQKFINLPNIKIRKHIFDGEHYWEIGKLGYSLKRIITDIENTGFRIIKTYRIIEHPYHRFFILEKY